MESHWRSFASRVFAISTYIVRSEIGGSENWIGTTLYDRDRLFVVDLRAAPSNDHGGAGDPAWPRACSGLIILMLFLSHLSWIQHLPWLIPALSCSVTKSCSRDGLSPLAKVALGLYVLIAVVLNYEVLGKQRFAVFLSFKPFTIGMLMIFILAVLMFQSRNTANLSLSPTSAAAYAN
jgi:hypothetical protein